MSGDSLDSFRRVLQRINDEHPSPERMKEIAREEGISDRAQLVHQTGEQAVAIAHVEKLVQQGATAYDVAAAIKGVLVEHADDRSRTTVAQYLVALRADAEILPYRSLARLGPLPTLSSVYQTQRLVKRQQSGDEFFVPVDLEKSIDEDRNVIVVAGPGLGKSTLLSHVVLLLTGPARPPRISGLVPIHVSAASLADTLSLSMSESLQRAASEELGQKLTERLPRDVLAKPPPLADKWLVLVDGLDEISDQRKLRRVIDAVNRVGSQKDSPFRFLVTSRWLASLDRFAESNFAQYALEPFQPEDTRRLVVNWFTALGQGGLAADFLESERSRLHDLARVPLLLTLALLGQTSKSKIPTSRAGLYRSLLRTVEEEEAEKDTRKEFTLSWEPELGATGVAAADDLFSKRTELLEYVARRRLDDPSCQPTAAAVEFARRWAALEKVDVSFLIGQMESLLRRTGLMDQRSGRMEFLHPTLGSYLVALAETRGNAPNSAGGRELVARRAESSWTEIALFSLGCWSDSGLDVSPQVDAVLHSGDAIFAGAVIADGVTIKSDVRRRVFDELLLLLRDQTPAQIVISGLLDVLTMLSSDTRLIRALRSFAREAGTEWVVRFQLARLLGGGSDRNFAVDSLLILASETKDSRKQGLAFSAVADIGSISAIPKLIDRAWDVTQTAEWRCAAAIAAARIRKSDEAAGILRELLDDSRLTLEQRVAAARGLAQVGRRRDLLKCLAKSLPEPVLLEVLRALLKAGDTRGVRTKLKSLADAPLSQAAGLVNVADLMMAASMTNEAAAVWRRIVNDPKADETLKVIAVSHLAEHEGGVFLALLPMYAANSANRQVHSVALDTLDRLARQDHLEARRLLIDLAKGRGTEVWAGVLAAERLAAAGDPDHLTAIAKDHQAEPAARVRAAVELSSLGWIRKSLSLLSAIAAKSAPIEAQLEAAKALVQLERHDLALPTLRRLCKDERVSAEATVLLLQSAKRARDSHTLRSLVRNHDLEPTCRTEAAEGLIDAGTGETAIPALIDILNQHNDEEARDDAASILGQLKSVQAVPALVDLAADRLVDVNTCRVAVSALAKIGALDQLLALTRLNDAPIHTRAESALVLVQHKHCEDVWPVLLAALYELSERSKEISIALATCNRWNELFEFALDPDRDYPSRLFALDALSKGGRHDLADEVLCNIAWASQSEEGTTSWQAVQILQKYGRKRALERLVKAFNSQDLLIHWATEALVAVSGQAELIDLLNSADKSVRALAGARLYELGRRRQALAALHAFAASTDAESVLHAAYRVNELGRREDAIGILLEIVRGAATHDIRRRAVELILKLAQGRRFSNVLAELSTAPGVDQELRGAADWQRMRTSLS